ncbi:MAG: ATP-binding protein [Candidatus Saccharimonas sp.]
MATQPITRFWHRRASEVTILITFVIGALFLWTKFGNLSSLNPPLEVHIISGVLAWVTFVIVLACYFITPIQQLKSSTYLNYLLTILTIIVLIAETNGPKSVYLPLFFVGLTFASLLGLAGTATGILSLAGFVAYEYYVSGLAVNDIVQLSAIGAIALAAGVLLWGRISASDGKASKADKSYQALANQLSQVAGKSEAVISAIGDGVIALNAHGVVQLINPAAERLLGWPSHDALNLNYKSVLKLIDSRNQEVDSTNDPITQAITSNTLTKNDNFSMQTQSGKSFTASLSVSPVGQPGEGVIVVFRDITTERSDERQRAEFISTASHEMRTPVASIEGYLGLTLNPKIAQIDDKAREYIIKAHESAEHLGRLFSDLLDVSKADDSRLKNDPRVVDVTTFVHDIVEGLTPKATAKNLIVTYKPMPLSQAVVAERRLAPVYYANVDNDHLREIVQNLFENAIKYTLKGLITIDVTGDEKSITISVADTGIGIPREDQHHLFQKFYRIDTSETREIGGTGLGLYLCRRLTETIGGQIRVESEYQKGSTFYVEIPRIGHSEATALIEQASIRAEKEAATVKNTRVAPETAAEAPVEISPEAPSPAPQPEPVPQPITQVPPQSPPKQIIVQDITTQTTTPTPTPVAPITVVAPTSQPVDTSTQAPDNTPLSVIEADPGKYIADRRSQRMSVPPR